MTLSRCPIVCFAATRQSEQARAFYRDVLGLHLVEENPSALVFDANGTMLRLQKVADLRPAQHTALGWQVADIRSVVDELSARRVRFERYEGLPQDEQGIWQTPDGAKVVWFKDPDGNILSLTQS